jgi:hypothetical protein
MKINHTLFIFSVLFLIACGDNSSDTNEMLVGSWDLVQMNGDGTASITKDGSMTESDVAITSGVVSYVITFTEGSYVTAGSYNVTNETSAINGGKIFEPVVYTNASGSGTYKIVDNIMTAGGPFIGIQISGVNLGLMAGEQESTLESMTTEELILSNTQEKSLAQGDSTVNVVLNSRSVWTKR